MQRPLTVKVLVRRGKKCHFFLEVLALRKYLKIVKILKILRLFIGS